MRQIECESLDHPGKIRITWCDQVHEKFENWHVRFKGEEEWWKIRKVFEPELDKADIKRDWKVGGL